MKKDLKTLWTHFVVVVVVIAIEWALKGVLHYAVEWGYLAKDTAETAGSILSWFMVLAILIFCVVSLIILIKNGIDTMRKGD